MLLGFAILALVSCASAPLPPSPPPQPRLAEGEFTSFDGSTLPYRAWAPEREVRLVVVGFHGIAGASTDFADLGAHLRTHLPGTAVYAPDLRGQGNDPDESRRGDIRTPRHWFEDAFTFTNLVRTRHPTARVIWCGESMGSLIALHAAAQAPGGQPPCDALILSSPIAKIRDDAADWRRLALRIGAALFPRCKISLEKLSGEEEVRVIRDVVHQDQVQNNSYHVSTFTLRMLNSLGNLIETVPAQAQELSLPVLLLHGGHDVFSVPEDVAAMQDQFGAPSQVERILYPESYHLLFYDHQSDRVLSDITAWIRTLHLR